MKQIFISLSLDLLHYQQTIQVSCETKHAIVGFFACACRIELIAWQMIPCQIAEFHLFQP